MRLILDSNIYCQDFSLSGTMFQTFLSELVRTGNSLFVPNIILEEVVNKYCVEYQRLVSQATRIGFVNYHRLPNLDEEKVRYRAYFQEKLSRVQYSLLGYPIIPHEVLAKKALEHKKPFKPNGQGYRDSLIWSTVLELAESGNLDPIGFISSNIRDFADELNNRQLHPNLVEDIERRSSGRRIGEIRYFPSLESFVREQIYPSLEIISDIETRLRSNTYENLNLMSFVEDELNEFALGKEFNSEEIGIPEEIGSANYSWLEDVISIEDISVMKISDNELLIEFSAKVECEFDFYAHRSYVFLHWNTIRPKSDITDEDEDFVPASISTEVILGIAIIYNVSSEQITSKQIISAHPSRREE
jgi:hypothetical protein